MHGTANALTTFATALLLGGVTLALSPVHDARVAVQC
jgi:hypothetical protein